MYIRLTFYTIYSIQTNFHNCSLLLFEMPSSLPLSLSLCLSLSLSTSAHNPVYCLYLLQNGQIGKSSDSLPVRKSVQPQLLTQNKLQPCSGHSSDRKISLKSGHLSDIKFSLQGFHSFQVGFHNCSSPRRASLLPWAYRELFFYT